MSSLLPRMVFLQNQILSRTPQLLQQQSQHEAMEAQGRVGQAWCGMVEENMDTEPGRASCSAIALSTPANA